MDQDWHHSSELYLVKLTRRPTSTTRIGWPTSEDQGMSNKRIPTHDVWAVQRGALDKRTCKPRQPKGAELQQLRSERGLHGRGAGPVSWAPMRRLGGGD
jgi:hypothetical protein